MIIYKILTAPEWAELQAQGATRGAPVDVADGFIHFSAPDQVRETAAKHFAGQMELWLLSYRADRLESLEWEPSRGGALFPHLYGPLTMHGLLEAVPLLWDGAAHVFPESVP
ncbi:MAG: DUF952 domain-containing protein [Pseudomonadota bacterium]